MKPLRRDAGPRPWRAKFADSFRGVYYGVRGQSSFRVHLAAAVLVVIAGSALEVSLAEWCLLVLAITLVLVAEMFNSSLEWLAKAVSRDERPELGRALDIASGAVLVASAGAAILGAIVFASAWLR